MITNSQHILKDYIQIGLENNQKLIREKLKIKLLEEKTVEAKGKFFPEIFLDASYTLSEGGRSIDFPAGDLLNPIYSTLDEIVEDNNLPASIPNVSEQLLPNNFHETKIRLIQPIFNSKIYYGYQAAKSEISVERAREKAFENQLKKQIKIAYFQYLSSLEKLRILENTRDLLSQLVLVNEKLVANGTATPNTIYAAQVEVQDNESKLAVAKKHLHSSRIFFNFLLDREESEHILEDTTVQNQGQSFFALKDLMRHAVVNRSEIHQVEREIDLNEAYKKLNSTYFLPEINLIGDIGFQGFGYTLNEDQDFWLLRVNLVWPLFKGFQNKSKVKQSGIRHDLLQSEYTEIQKRIKMEVSRAFYAFLESQESLSANNAELFYAKENFRVVLKKYKENLALPIELKEARTQYTNAQLKVAISKYQLLIREAELEAAANLI